MLQIGYFSTARGLQNADVVHKILVAARTANRRDSITGLLVAGGGRYLQVIEGPDFALETLYASIQKDDRHLAVARFLRRETTERSFGSWSMAFRRSTRAGEPSSFIHVLRALTAEIQDMALKRQIRHFVHATMMSDGPA